MGKFVLLKADVWEVLVGLTGSFADVVSETNEKKNEKHQGVPHFPFVGKLIILKLC